MSLINLIFSLDVTDKAQTPAGYSGKISLVEMWITASATLLCRQHPALLGGDLGRRANSVMWSLPSLSESEHWGRCFFPWRTVATVSGNVHSEISKHLALADKDPSFSQDVDSTVFSINSSASGAQPPPSPLLVASICPPIHGYSRGSPHVDSATCTLFRFLVRSSVCEQRFQVLPLKKVKFSAAPLGETAGL